MIEKTRRTFSLLLRLQFGLIVPLCYLLHGALYAQGGAALSTTLFIVVYLIKLTYLGVAVIGFLLYGAKIFSDPDARRVTITIAALSYFSINGSLLHTQYISPFYFFADLLGFSVFALYFSVLKYHFSNTPRLQAEIFDLSRLNVIAYAAVVLIYFTLSQGMKVSTPPDNAVTIAICLGILFTHWRDFRTTDKLLVLGSVIVIVALSGMRILLLVPLICLLFIGLQVSRSRGLRPLITVGAAFLVGLFITNLIAGDQVIERLLSIRDAGMFFLSYTDTMGVDASIAQRVIEADLILAHMNQHPSTFIFGGGFGALYENSLIDNDHYSSLQHHAHSTPLVLLLRNGPLGFVLYCALFVIAIKNLLHKTRLISIASLALFCQWISALFDQYAYWAFHFAFAMALLSSLRRS